MSDRYPLPTGQLAARLHGVRMELRERAASAIEASLHAEAAGQTEFAASLRGKARGYHEADTLLLALERRHRFPKRWLRRRRALADQAVA